MTPISQDLIEKALALTNKHKGHMMETRDSLAYEDFNIIDDITEFSYPKFYAYLLSSEFIEKYTIHTTILSDKNDVLYWIKRFGQAIYNHQSGDSKPLEELLSKI